MAPTTAGLGRFLVVEEPPQDVHDGIGVTGQWRMTWSGLPQ